MARSNWDTRWLIQPLKKISLRLIFRALMKPIQLVDLRTQYHKIKPEIDGAILEILDNSAFIGGEHVQLLSKELEKYLDVKHVIPCANGTDALQIALMALDCRPGDEILTPSFTYIATCEVIGLLGLKPVFVEVNPDDFTLSIEDAKSKITDKTKAIVPVHLYGHCANMDSIMELSRKFNLAVIEDTAQAIGAKFTSENSGLTGSAGCIGHIGTSSFFPSKNLGCYGDGGAMMTNDDALAAKIRMIANHGQSERYYHDIIGVNSRLDNIQAAVLRIKLKHLNEYASARQKVAEQYNAAFESIPQIITPLIRPWSTHVYHQYTIKLDGFDRSALQKHLSSKGIPTNVYYPVPAHLQKGYVQYGYGKGDLPITEMLCAQVLSLPIHTEMENDQLTYIIDSIIEFTKK